MGGRTRSPAGRRRNCDPVYDGALNFHASQREKRDEDRGCVRLSGFRLLGLSKMRQPPPTSPTRKQPDRQPFVPSSALRHFVPTHPKIGGCPSSTSGGRRQKACAKASDMGAATPKGPGWRILPKFAATRFSRRAPVCMRLWHFSCRETPETQSSIRRHP